jgi:glycosyltransferase involved in cell wall biosynthesis
VVKWPAVRVLRLITRLNIGGPSIQAITLSDRLTARGFTTKLVHGALGAAEGDMRYLLPASVDVDCVPTLRREIAPASDVNALARVLDLIREFRPQIIHTHMAKAGGIGRLAARLHNRQATGSARVKVVHTYHGHVLDGYFSPLVTSVFLGIERSLARTTDRIVAISPAIRDELLKEQRIGAPEQYSVVPLGFDLTKLAAVDDTARQSARASLGVAPTAHVVSTVGRLTAIKQHRLFLETARLVAAADPNAMFLVAGDGELRADLEQAARSFGLAGRVRFLGWRRDLDVIYGATDVFLLTSRNEGTPVALIESLAAGVPGVSTDVGGVRDVFQASTGSGEPLGLLAPFDDAPGLARAVDALIIDPPRRRAMGERGRTAMLSRYGIDRLVDDVESLYRGLLA